MKSTTIPDEQILSQLAFAAYINGRLAGVLPEASRLREKLATRYAAPRHSPVEPLSFLIGLRDHDGVIRSPSALLAVACTTLELSEQRRKRHRDTRWGVRP